MLRYRVAKMFMTMNFLSERNWGNTTRKNKIKERNY